MAAIPLKAHALQLINQVNDRDLVGIGEFLEQDLGAPWKDVILYEFDLYSLVNISAGPDQDLILQLLSYEIKSITCFHLAALKGLTDTLMSFLGKDIPVDACTSYGSSALQMASFAGRLDTARALLDVYQADVNFRDKYGCTPLHAAALQGHDSMVLMLLWFGADLYIRDENNQMAVFYAQQEGHGKIIQAMCELGGEQILKEITGPNAPTRRAHPTENPNPLRRQQSMPAPTARTQREGNNGNRIPKTQTMPKKKQQSSTPIANDVNANAEETDVSDRSKYRTLRRIMREELSDMLSDYMHPRSLNQTPEDSHRQVQVGASTLREILKDELRQIVTEREGSRGGIGSHGGGSGEPLYETLPGRGNAREHNDVPTSPAPPPPDVPISSHPKLRGSTSSASPDNNNSFTFLNPASPPYKTRNDSELFMQLPMNNHLDESTLQIIFYKIASRVGRNWEPLAAELGIAPAGKMEEKISQIMQRYPGQPEEQAHMALQEWRKTHRSQATIDNLIYAMRACHLHHEVDDVQRVTQEYNA